MITRLKAFAPTLAAVLAISAIAASAAQAEESADFWAEAGTVKLDADNERSLSFVMSARTLICNEITAHASYSGEYNAQTVTNIGYSGCHTTTMGIELPTTVLPETDCHYTVTAGTYTNSGNGLADGSVHICGHTIEVYNSPHPSGSKRCEIHVPAQTVNGLKFRNTTTPNEAMGTTVEANQAQVANVTTTDFNTLGCNNHTTETVTYAGNAWVEGTNEAEEATDNTVTGT